MDVGFINPFLKATEEVSGRMVNTPAELIRTDETRRLSGDSHFVNGIVELSGDVEGVVV